MILPEHYEDCMIIKETIITKRSRKKLQVNCYNCLYIDSERMRGVKKDVRKKEIL